MNEQEKVQKRPDGLPAQLKANVEAMSGYSMDDVRVHYNSSKPAQMKALAYTQGTDIHVAPGQEQYLGHEAWHVVQQKQGRVAPTAQLKGVNVNTDDSLEHEADVMGARALVFSIPVAPVVQRKETNRQQGAPMQFGKKKANITNHRYNLRSSNKNNESAGKTTKKKLFSRQQANSINLESLRTQADSINPRSFKTLPEVEEIIKKMAGVKEVNLEDIPEKVQKEIASAFNEMAIKLPKSRNIIQKVYSTNPKEVSDRHAKLIVKYENNNTWHADMAINREKFAKQDLDSTLTQLHDTNQMAGKGVQSIIFHEIGHAMHVWQTYLNSTNMEEFKNANDNHKFPRQNINDAINKFKEENNINEFNYFPSSFARPSESEYQAECIAKFMNGDLNDDKERRFINIFIETVNNNMVKPNNEQNKSLLDVEMSE